MSDPFRLAVIGVRYPPETFLDRRYKAIADRGVSVEVYSSDIESEQVISGVRWKPLIRPGLRPRSLRVSIRLLMRACLSPLWLAQAVYFAATTPGMRLLQFLDLLPFRELSADVLHFEWVLSVSSYRNLIRFAKRPVVVSLRGSQVKVAPLDPRRPEVAARLREGIQLATRVHCVSEDILAAATRFGLHPSNARVVRPAVDPGMFVSADSPDESRSLRLISVGSLKWVKGFETALIAVRMALLSGINLRYEIVGDGEERTRLSFAIRELGLVNHVVLAGQRTPADVAISLGSADAFILASVDEGIANAALEAMASGLPVLTSDCGGMTEVITDGIEGFVWPSRDSASLCQAIVRLATMTSAARRSMGERGRERVHRSHTLRTQTEDWILLYREVLGARADSSTPPAI